MKDIVAIFKHIYMMPSEITALEARILQQDEVDPGYDAYSRPTYNHSGINVPGSSLFYSHPREDLESLKAELAKLYEEYETWTAEDKKKYSSFEDKRNNILSMFYQPGQPSIYDC